jgi:hypothetical protein
MVKTPRTRHSRTEREPMTIELGPDDVSRVESESEAEPAAGTAKEDAAAASDAPSGEAVAEPGAAVTDEPLFAEEPKPAEDPASREEPAQQPRTSFSGPQPQAAPPPPRTSRGAALTAGLAGGVVALLAGGLLQYAGVLGTPDRETALPDSVQTELSELKSEIATLKAAPGDTGDVSGRIDGLSQALEQVRTDVASLRQTVQSGAGAGLEALNTKIAEIETRIAAIGTGSQGAAPEEIAAINEKIAALDALANAAREAGAAVDRRLGALEQSVAALSGKVDAQAQQPKVALAIAASALKAAIERGSPFESELETLVAVAPQAPGLAELRPYAEKGIATRAELVAETGAAAKVMIAAADPPSEDADFFERLLSSAESLVEVRPIGAVEGPGVPETVARMEVALQEGDLEKAIAEFDTLPEPVKAAGAAFADRIRARIAVEQLADQAIASAMQAP